MSVSTRYRINAPAVIHDRGDGQTVVINLLTGHYFRLDETSSRLWDRLEAEPDEATLVGACTNPEQFLPQLPAILAELLERGLIVASLAAAPTPPSAGERWTFAGFRLESFTDLEDILGLDPIHEADPDAGWPRSRAA